MLMIDQKLEILDQISTRSYTALQRVRYKQIDDKRHQEARTCTSCIQAQDDRDGSRTVSKDYEAREE